MDFLILKTTDGNVHKGWVTWSGRMDDTQIYHLSSPEGNRQLYVAVDKIVYIELLHPEHNRIPADWPMPQEPHA